MQAPRPTNQPVKRRADQEVQAQPPVHTKDLMLKGQREMRLEQKIKDVTAQDCQKVVSPAARFACS